MHQPESAPDGMEAAGAAAGAGAGPVSSIVFQCAGCRRVLGDSLALVNADEELRNITLHGAPRASTNNA